MAEEIVVLVTTGSEEEAKTISRQLVKDGLVACANIVPQIQSIFQWDGKVSEEQETLIILKTKGHIFHSLEAAIKTLHSYSVPEIIALPIEMGSSDYLSWLGQMVKPSCIQD